MKKIICFFVIAIAKATAFALKLIRPGGGSTFPGVAAATLWPDFLRNVVLKDTCKVIYITGSCGKTSTTNLLMDILEKDGKTVCGNRLGANLFSGIATAILQYTNLRGKCSADYIVMEVDERFLSMMNRHIQPDFIVVTNILKDQVQRNGEPAVIYNKIKESISENICIVLNADEPNSASLGYGQKHSVYFGVGYCVPAQAQADFFHVTEPCPVCGRGLVFEYENIQLVGKYSCDRCGLGSALPQTKIDKVDFIQQRFWVGGAEYPLNYSDIYYLYSCAAALCVAQELSVSSEVCKNALNDFRMLKKREKQLPIPKKTVTHFIFKQDTPISFQNAINAAAEQCAEKTVLLYLGAVVDFVPNYLNIGYAYDCDLSALTCAKRFVCFSEVCYETKNWLMLAGVDEDKIITVPPDGPNTFFDWIMKSEDKDFWLIADILIIPRLSVQADKLWGGVA